MDKPRPIRNLVLNRRAKHDYFLSDTMEAGVSLLGPEVKSLRCGKANLREAYVRLTRTGAVLAGCHISAYEEANRQHHDPLRERPLLLNRSELNKLRKATRDQGVTVIPTRIYLKGNRVKIEIAVAKVKKHYHKRHSLKEKAARREMQKSRR